MATIEKLYQSIMSGAQDKNIKFQDLQRLLDAMGFDFRGNLPENINIQPIGNMAKPYQVKQVRNYLLKYQITL